jgi:hypothetical protein
MTTYQYNAWTKIVEEHWQDEDQIAGLTRVILDYAKEHGLTGYDAQQVIVTAAANARVTVQQ